MPPTNKNNVKYSREQAKNILQGAQKYLPQDKNGDNLINSGGEINNFLDTVYGSSNDLTVSPIQSTPVGISPSDHRQQFATDSNRLDDITGANNVAGGQYETKDQVQNNTANGNTDETITYDDYYKQQGYDKTIQQDRLDGIEAKQRVETMYNTELARIDAEVSSALQRINSTFDQRIKTQERINRQRIDSQKSFGLSSGMALYMPNMIKDSISLREEEASQKIQELESERSRLISEAKLAKSRGMSKALRDKMNMLDKVDSNIRDEIRKVEKESRDRYNLLLKQQKQEQDIHNQKVKDMITNIKLSSSRFADEFSNAKGEKEQDAVIEKMLNELGADPETFKSMAKSYVFDTVKKRTVDNEKSKYVLDKAKADANWAQARASKEWQNYRNAVKSGSKTGGTTKDGVPIPKNRFKDEQEFRDYVDDYLAKYGAKGEKELNAVFGDRDKYKKEYKWKDRYLDKKQQSGVLPEGNGGKDDPLGLGI